jgi:hypothetical protein
MKPAFSAVDQDRTVSTHAQEIEYALILQGIITAVKDDPVQMRTAIYEYARARLKNDTAELDDNERTKQLDALETAIQGVERYSLRRDGMGLLPPPDPAARIGQAKSPEATSAEAASAEAASAAARSSEAKSSEAMSSEAKSPEAKSPPAVAVVTPVVANPVVTPAPEDIIVPPPMYWRPEVNPIFEVKTPPLAATFAWFCLGMLVFALVTGVIYYKSLSILLSEHLDFARLSTSQVARSADSPSAPDASQQASPPAEVKPSARIPPPFPVPTDYGIYALSSDGALSELSLLPERVPDKRIAMSTPVSKASLTSLPDGKAKFILYRRDLAGNAPERVDVRVVARVVRAMVFDARGKPSYKPVSDAWSIRNKTYEFRVRPVPRNPEMLLVQPENADFVLPPGRYVLVLKDQGYDFTVAGTVTDLAQCLERTDAANGEFYSECQKP